MRLSEEKRRRIVEGVALKQKELNLTDEELARRISVSEDMLGEIRSGGKALERRSYLERLIVALELLPKAKGSSVAYASLPDYLASLGEEDFLEFLLDSLPPMPEPALIHPHTQGEPWYPCPNPGPWEGPGKGKCVNCRKRFPCWFTGG